MVEERLSPDDLKRNALDFVSHISSVIKTTILPNTPSIIVAGPQRCGKSTVAKLISKDQKMFHLESDYVRDRLYGKLIGDQRTWSATFAFRKILTLFPHGILAEGTVFTDDAKSVPFWGSKNGRDIPVYFIGSTSDYNKKYEAMLSFRKYNSCWTSQKISNSELLRLAERITKRSFVYKELCLKHGFTYFDIDPLNFDRDITRIATNIISK